MATLAIVALCLVRAMDTGSIPDEPGPRCFRLQRAGDRGFWGQLNEERLELLEKLNRRDRRHLKALDTLVVPCEWDHHELTYSPFPLRFAGVETSKVVVVEKGWQAFGAYENGALVRWGPISSGRRTKRTPAGLYHLNWRSRGRYSTVNPRWYLKWYFNFENTHGLSFHQYALPGRPASHACIRLLDRDARWLYGWGEEWTLDATGRTVLRSGTPVLIVERFDFESRPPWRSPEDLARGIALPEDIDP